MDSRLTIQQAAGVTGLSEHTLRYYERIGLIAPVERAPNGHRRYSNEDISWIGFLNRLRSTGMPISKMLRFTALQREGGATLHERLALLESHRREVKQKIQELSDHLALLELKISYYSARADLGSNHSEPDTERCHMLEGQPSTAEQPLPR
jgi:DNA-binding transcriptional MerR regulator